MYIMEKSVHPIHKMELTVENCKARDVGVQHTTQCKNTVIIGMRPTRVASILDSIPDENASDAGEPCLIGSID